jgi:hypothetical protein
MAILPPQGAALPASDASWIMLKEVMPSGPTPHSSPNSPLSAAADPRALPGTKEAHAVNGDKRGQGSLVDSAATEKPHVGEYLIVTVGDPGVARQMVLADPDEPIGMDSATAENRPSRRTLRRFSGW